MFIQTHRSRLSLGYNIEYNRTHGVYYAMPIAPIVPLIKQRPFGRGALTFDAHSHELFLAYRVLPMVKGT